MSSQVTNLTFEISSIVKRVYLKINREMKNKQENKIIKIIINKQFF